MDHFKENLGCLKVKLNAEQMEKLDKVSAISPGFPHDMLAGQAEARNKSILNHRQWFTS